MMFFKSEGNLKSINKYISNTRRYLDDNDNDNDDKKNINKRVTISLKIAESIDKHPDKWDEMCQYNIERGFAASLIHELSIQSNAIESINNIYTLYARLYFEFDLKDSYYLDTILNMKYIKNKIIDDINDPAIASEIIYIAYTIPMQKLERFSSDKNVENLLDFNNILNKAKNKKDEWEKIIKDKEKEVKTISDKLDSLNSGYNFVGLFDAFKSLSEEKHKEINRTLCLLNVIGLFLVAIPIMFEYYIINNVNIKELSLKNIFMYIPVISIELLVLYFFRIVLINYNSIKAQIIQIELRQTLCRFIQRYAEYAADIKEKHNISLEKFENLIFSGIVSDSEKLPSTFDGLEQMGAFIKSITNK
ncbi:hypothetical protein [Photobacterium damselae]|uniref:hypothetical protein n=1 Tax=Photobacterium damselae TaxID=38293 RepID=UPI001EDEDC7D|nr:hypothetical protein [Photobacterium damselae]MCG3845718.1 hypothetical protein [Photobacterium damselae]